MLNIFFVSNDIRVEKLIEHYQPFFKTKIRRASDFDQGLKEVFENRPGLVFIQSSINEVSGETVARHIKLLLGGGSPLIVSLGDSKALENKGATWCDECIGIHDSDRRLQDEFEQLIARLYPGDWYDISRDMGLVSPDAPDEIPGAVRQPAEEITAELSENAGWSAIAGGRRVIDDQPGAGSAERKFRMKAGVFEKDRNQDEVLAPEGSDYYASILENADTWSDKRRKGKTRRYLLSIFLLAAIGSGAYFRLHREGSVQQPAGPQKTVVQPGKAPGLMVAIPVRMKAREGLPSFISAKWRDMPYSAKHPGWERYLSSRFDIRLFREKETVKALQVYALDNGVIPDSFISLILREFGYVGPLPEGNAVQKDGFLMVRSSIEGFAEFESYKEMDTRRTRAIVLVFS